MAGVLFYIFFLVFTSKGLDANSLKLEQVLILSRHHVRSPLVTNVKVYSPRTWPYWDEETVGFLTPKGFQMEGYLAEYISDWLAQEKLINGCPDEKDVLIRPNTKPRTISTAEAFVQSAFPNCSVQIQILSEDQRTHGFDFRFYPVYHNKSEVFAQVLTNEINAILNEEDLTDMYLLLNKILDIENSTICKTNGICDLSKEKDEVISIGDDEEPNIKGPLSTASGIVDGFTMAYYEGRPIEEVAWGQIKTEDEWKLLSKAIKQSQKSRFNVTSGLKDISAPLLQYMLEILENKTKFALLVGHDSNFNPVVSSLIDHYELPGSHEPFPIGGKLVFQKWTDEQGRSFLKVEYIYQSRTQIRLGEKLSLASPPQRVLLTLKDCQKSKEAEGLCPWEEFMSILRSKL